MDIQQLKKNVNRGKIIFITGIFMLFEKIKYSVHVGIIMMIIGFFMIRIFQNKINFEKNKIIIIEYIKDNIIKCINEQVVEKPKNIKNIKEINIIGTFKKMYQLNNTIINIINTSNIDNIIINNNNIIYDDVSLFLDIYLFVKKFELIQNINSKFVENKLIFDYYKYYYNIISHISNIENDKLISIAISHLVEDYYNNQKQLHKLINNLLIYNNKEEWFIDNNIIKSILNVFNNIISQNLDDKANKFDSMSKN
jgi:hypothetical protein